MKKRRAKSWIIENWLHIAISPLTLRVYTQPQPASDWSDFWQIASFVPLTPDCNTTLFSPSLDPFAPSKFRPCSLNQTTELYDLAYPAWVYTVLESGISDVTSGFNQEDFTQLGDKIIAGTGAFVQVVTHMDPKTNLSHALLFFPFAAEQFSNGSLSNFGIDFVAETTSMATTCEPIAQACELRNASQSTSNNFSIPFNCSSMFFGDLNLPPTGGLEQFKGWDTNFYAMENGNPRNISVASQLNPFLFNATAAVISTAFTDLEGSGNQEVVVDAGNNRVALTFRLVCCR
jgi:hypothetical protein